MPLERVRRLLAVKETDSWSNHKADVDEVCLSGALGLSMFRFARDSNNSQTAGDLIENILIENLGQIQITEAAVESCDEVAHAKIANLPACDEQRTIYVPYLNFEVQREVSSLDDEYKDRKRGFILTRALLDGPAARRALVPLYNELEVCGAPQDLEGYGVADEVVAVQNRVRKQANKNLPTEKQKVGSLVIDHYSQKEVFYSMVDPMITFERDAHTQLANDIGLKILQDSVYRIVPAGEGMHNAKEVATELTVLKSSALFRYCVDAVQSVVNTAIGWVEAIAKQTLPSLKGAEDDPFLKKIKGRLIFFMWFQPSSGSSSDIVFLGRMGLTKLFLLCQSQAQKGEKPDLPHVRILNTFAWLLSPMQAQQHSEWSRGLYESAVAKGKASVAKGATETAKRRISSKQNPEEKSEAVHESTMALFKKRKAR